MTSVWATRHRLLTERLRHLIGSDDQDLARLAAAGFMLLTRHQLDEHGRCRYCCRPAWWPRSWPVRSPGAGVAKNIQAGVLVRGGTVPRRAAEHITELKARGVLEQLRSRGTGDRIVGGSGPDQRNGAF